MTTTIAINGNDLTIEQLVQVVYACAEVTLEQAARTRMEASRAVIERLLSSGASVYGVNT